MIRIKDEAARRARLIAIALLLVVAESECLAAEPLEGNDLYTRCAACHQQDGSGVPGLFPSLAKRLGPLAALAPGRDYLVLVLERGLIGEVRIGPSSYQGAMPAQGASLGDEGVAAVLNYVLKHLNRETLPREWRDFSADEVAQIKTRYLNSSPTQLLHLRAVVFSGLEK